MPNALIGGCAVLLYLLSGGLLGRRLSHPDAHPGRGRILLLGLLAIILHALLLTPHLLDEGLSLGFFNALSASGWLIGAVLLLAALAYPVENLGIILWPFSALTLLLGLMLPSAPLEGAADWRVQMHAVVSLLAYSLLALAAMQALLLAIQHRRLHDRRPGGFLRGIPALSTTEALLFQMLGVGFALLSLSLVTGLFFLEDIFAQHLVHKTTLSLFAWLVLAVILWGRWRHGWRGRVAVGWILGAFVALVLAYFGSKLVLELILER